MPVAKGSLGNCLARVLRDNGCNTVVVRPSLVPKKKICGTYRPVVLLDRTLRCLPEAMVFLDTPFFVGEVRARCMREANNDVVLRYIKGTVSLDDPNHGQTYTA